MWLIVKSNNPTMAGAFRSRGVVTLYFNEAAAWEAWKLFLSEQDKDHYTVRSVEVADE